VEKLNPLNLVEFFEMYFMQQKQKLLLMFSSTLNAPAEPTRFGVFRM
jgi:hypothetical protein